MSTQNEGDDLCDLCYSSGVNVERTTICGKTIGIECGCEAATGDICGPYCEECRERNFEHDEEI